MNEHPGSRSARIAWAIWQGVLMLNTIALLAVAAYAAITSPEDGPGATPLLMAGLLSLGVITLAIMSAVNALLWGSVTHARWRRRLAFMILGLIGAVIVLQLAIYASDHNDPAMRWVGLVLFPLSVIAAYALNRSAVSQSRARGTNTRPRRYSSS